MRILTADDGEQICIECAHTFNLSPEDKLDDDDRRGIVLDAADLEPGLETFIVCESCVRKACKVLDETAGG